MGAAQGSVAGRGGPSVTPNLLPVSLVVVGVIATLAYSILGWTGMR